MLFDIPHVLPVEPGISSDAGGRIGVRSVALHEVGDTACSASPKAAFISAVKGASQPTALLNLGCANLFHLMYH